MTLTSAIALAGATFLFAVLPGPGITSIVAQSVARGFRHGVMWIVGTVAGDMIFLGLVLLGLGLAASAMGEWFVVLKYLGAAYLVYLGVMCWMSKPPSEDDPERSPVSRKRCVAGGMCMSLGNPKVMAFYGGFLPQFVDMTTLTVSDAALVFAIICPIVFVVPLGYAWLAARGRRKLMTSRVWKTVNRSAGAVMIGAGAAGVAE